MVITIAPIVSHHFWGFIFENSCKMSCILKILCIFTLLSFNDRAEMPNFPEGFFYSLKNKDVAPPCIDRNGLYSPVEGLSKGSGGIPIYCLHIILLKMLKNSTGATAPEKAISADEIIKKLFDSDFTDDLRTDLREMIDAYLLSEDEPHYRDQRYSSFMWIDSLLKDIQLYQAQSQIKLVS